MRQAITILWLLVMPPVIAQVDPSSGGSSTPAGSDEQVQVNTGGSFAGATGFTYDDDGTDRQVTVTGLDGTAGIPFALFTTGANKGCGFYSDQSSSFTDPRLMCEDNDCAFASSIMMGYRSNCSTCPCTSIGPRDVSCGQKSVCISGGTGSLVGGNDGVYLGCSGGSSSVCIGESSNAGDTASTTFTRVLGTDIDTNEATSPFRVTAIGEGIDLQSGVSDVIAFGDFDRDAANDITCSNCIQFGGSDNDLTQARWGEESEATPDDFTHVRTAASGTNTAGANHIWQAGQSTGTGAPGDLLFSKCPADAGSGSTVNDCTTTASWSVDGETGMPLPPAYTADPCSGGEPESGIFWNDTANVHCFCDGTNDLKISDSTACF